MKRYSVLDFLPGYICSYLIELERQLMKFVRGEGGYASVMDNGSGRSVYRASRRQEGSWKCFQRQPDQAG